MLPYFLNVDTVNKTGRRLKPTMCCALLFMQLRKWGAKVVKKIVRYDMEKKIFLQRSE